MPAAFEDRPVLHILRAPLGGAFRHVYDLAIAQSERGLAVGLVCDSADYGAGSRDKLARLGALDGLGVIRLQIPREPGLRDAAALKSLRTRLRADPPAVVHGHGAKGAAYARILAPMLGSTAVCTPHGGALHYSFRSVTGAVYLCLERALKHRTGGMIFESEYARQQYADKVGSVTFPHRVIYNGLFDEEFTPINAESAQYDFLFIGEFRELKGIFTLLEAVQTLRANGLAFKVLMAGSGPDEGLLRERVQEAGLADVVTLSAAIHPARAAFEQARCIVAPSLNESMPYIVLEAIAARVPLITTAVGGIPEIYGPMKDRLISPGDAGSLAASLTKSLRAPEQGRREAHELHRHVRGHLTVREMEEQVFEFYQSVAADGARAVAGGKAAV